MTDKMVTSDVAGIAYKMALDIWKAEHGVDSKPKFEHAANFLKIVSACSKALHGQFGSASIDGLFEKK